MLSNSSALITVTEETLECSGMLFDTASSSSNVVLLFHLVASENRTHDQQHFMGYIKNIFFNTVLEFKATIRNDGFSVLSNFGQKITNFIFATWLVDY